MKKEYQLSNFFLSNSVATEEEDSLYCMENKESFSTRAFIEKKRIKKEEIVNNDQDRTICAMLRNVNFTLHHKHLNEIAKLTNFANNCVAKLREYKRDFDSDMWKNSNDFKKQKGAYVRSHFSKEKYAIGEQLILNNQHSFFVTLKKIFDTSNKESVKDQLIEISYYANRLNEKLIEYENR